MLLFNLGELLRREAVGKPNQRRPQTAMDQGDLAIDKSADKNLLRASNGLKNCVDVVTLRVCPPATLDRFPDDGLGETGRRSFS